MKKIIIALIVLLSIAKIATAETTATVHLANKYLAFGSGGVLHDDFVIQSGATTTFDNGLYLGTWFSYSPDGKSNFGDEIDLKVGWSGNFKEIWNIDYSLTYFNEPDLLEFSSGDIFYNKMSISRKFHDYKIALNIENYSPTGGSKFDGGWLIGMSVSRYFNFDRFGLFANLALNYDDGGFGKNNGFVINPFISFSMNVSEKITLDIIQANGYLILTDDARENDIMWSTGVSINF